MNRRIELATTAIATAPTTTSKRSRSRNSSIQNFQAILGVHCSTTLEGSDADLCEQIARRNAGDLRTLAADKGYDKNALRERPRETEIRPLIKHCVRAPYNHAHNARSTKISTHSGR